jgi:hypothetical protein
MLWQSAFLQAAFFDNFRLLVIELGELIPRPTFHSQQLGSLA